MTKLKHFIELKILKLYCVLLDNNLFVFLCVIDLILPKSKFKLQNKNSIQKNLEADCTSKLPQFAQEIFECESSTKHGVNYTLIFFVPNSGDNLTKSTILNLAMSLTAIDNVEFIVMTRFGEVILSSEVYANKLSVEDVIQINPDYIFFEIHTIFDNHGLLEEQNLYNIKKHSKAKIIGICFDIWRAYDLNFISKWSNLSDYFIHMDQKSVTTHGLDANKLIFWPYAGWVNTIEPKLNKNKVIYFSGNIKPSDRRYVLRVTKKISQKLKLQMAINKADHSELTGLKSEAIYFNQLNNSQYILGLSQKSQNVTLVTFRSLEAIFLNCTLIQQELEGDSPLSEMFTPYDHYLPFSSLNDLEIILKEIKINDSKYVLVGKNAGEFMAKHYSPEKMWSYLFSKLAT